MATSTELRNRRSAGETTYHEEHSVHLIEIAPSTTSLQASESTRRPPLINLAEKKSSFKRGQQSASSRNVRDYYESQAKLLEEFESLADDERSDGAETSREENGDQSSLRLSQISLFANLVLLIAKAFAAGLSGSISVISSLVDSAVDLLSGLVIWYTSRAIQHSNPYLYPSGRRRLEPLAVVVLSVVMTLASFQLTLQSLQSLYKAAEFLHDTGNAPHFQTPTVVITASTVAIKFFLYVICYVVSKKQGTVSASVDVLIQDHRNDILSNAVALVCGYLGSTEFVAKSGVSSVVFIDPIGASIVSVYILLSWWRTGLEQVEMLTGMTAQPEFLSKVTWLSLHHDSRVSHVDTVRAFHFGQRFLVEVHIVLPRSTALENSHHVGESLQQRLERMPEVERAFVHVDWETRHFD